MSRPLQLSPETALRLSKELKVPLEHLMHMPKHILLQKIAELAKSAEPAAERQEAGTAGLEQAAGEPQKQQASADESRANRPEAAEDGSRAERPGASGS